MSAHNPLISRRFQKFNSLFSGGSNRNLLLAMVIILSGLLLITFKSFAAPLPREGGMILYVKENAEGVGDGSSWIDAYPNLNQALNAAQAHDQIWVARGVYTPGTMQSQTFLIEGTLKVYGGFEGVPGTEANFDSRDWETFITVLSGDIDGDDITDPNGIVLTPADIVGNNSFHVVEGRSSSLLDGVTVTGGQALGDGEDRYGGGMYNATDDPFLNNVNFIGNKAEKGGGMYNKNSSPVLTNVTFSGCGAVWGGGMYNVDSSPILMDVTFEKNKAGSMGGGVYNLSSDPSLTRVSFLENNAGQTGGGMRTQYSRPTLNQVIFFGNTANYAGGMYSSYGGPILTNVYFFGNHADETGGGMSTGSNSRAALINVIFSGNSAGQRGGGMHNSQSPPTLTNVTFSGNSAKKGGGIYNHNGSDPTIQNGVFWGNTAVTSGTQIYNDFNSTSLLADNLVQEGCPFRSTCKGRMLTINPNFARDPDPDNNDYGDLHLQINSPAIDIGNNDHDPDPENSPPDSLYDIPFDYAGNGRIAVGIGVPIPVVDLGAYEYQIADILITQEASTLSIHPRDPLTYTLTVSNTGPYDAFNLVITDTLPMDVGFASDDCAINTSPWVWEIAWLPAGSSLQCQLNVTVTLQTLGVITNTAVVTSTTPDPYLENNFSTIETSVFPETDLSITKTASKDEILPGDSLIYTITVANLGPDIGQEIVVMETFPEGVTFMSDTCGVNSIPWVWEFDVLFAGDRVSCLVTVMVDEDPPETMVNTVEVMHTTYDLDLSNNTALVKTLLFKRYQYFPLMTR